MCECAPKEECGGALFIVFEGLVIPCKCMHRLETCVILDLEFMSCHATSSSCQAARKGRFIAE